MATTRAVAQRTPPDREPSIAPDAGGAYWIVVRGAAHNNLQRIDAAIPLGRFTCVTGVSGSGKSTLVNEILYAALARDLNGAHADPGLHDRVDIVAPGGAERELRKWVRSRDAGAAPLDKIIAIDQAPIGRTPRSNPATYIKLFDEIRSLFTKLPDAKLRGYKSGRFSFNVPLHRGGGRCEACEGNGANRIEMDFLADVWVACPVCEGRRFTRETLQIRFGEHRRPGGYSISDVLEMDVQQALEVFENQPRIHGMIRTLHDVGLDYIKLGQPSPTLSGGEAQRIKLARELVKKSTGRTIYVLDEPTTGLHFEDVRRLLAVLHGFVDAGNTVVVIEHNLDVIKTADWILDLGPEGGAAGGRVVAEGTPEQVASCESSFTGKALRQALWGEPAASELGVAGEAASAWTAGDPHAIRVVGAAQHNLKNVTIDIPRDRMTVCAGLSGSGKTSFAIDTVYTEGYRRYVESLSAYARQFLGQLQKPRVDHIEGLSPAICIEQRSAGHNPRSTVGTVTEVYDYMRVLWARVGAPCCTSCGRPVGSQTVDEIVARVLALEPAAPIILLAPIALSEGESYAAMFTRLKASGYSRVRVDGEIRQTAHAVTLDARRKHRVEVVIDRTVVRAGNRGRIAESVEHALALGDGVVILVIEEIERIEDEARVEPGSGEAVAARVVTSPPREIKFSQRLACIPCGISYEPLSPHHFSFNNQLGWCETCEGLGVQRGAPAASIVRDPSRSLLRGAIAGWPSVDPQSPFGRVLVALCARIGIAPDAPLESWTPQQLQTLMFGTSGDWIAADVPARAASSRRRGAPQAPPPWRFHWRGFFPAIDNATRNSWEIRHRLHNVVTDVPCIACRGGRLRPDAAAVRLIAGVDSPLDAPATDGATIVEVCRMPLEQALAYFQALKLTDRQRRIAGELLREIINRLRFLVDVGLEYLNLHRPAPTLSGGEAQRIRLASQLGSGLCGVLYVLDEPTIGLHPRDTQRLVRAIARLRDLGNTLLLVEHDREVIRAADRLLDFGPGAGALGGRIVASGSPADFIGAPPKKPARRGGSAKAAVEEAPASGDAPADESLTRAYLSGAARIDVPENRRPVALDRAILAPDVPPPRARRRSVARPGRGEPQVVSPDEPVRDWIVIRGARHNNLRNLTAAIPLRRLVCVTGVSGSGKSSLVHDVLWPAAAARFKLTRATPGAHERVDGLDAIDKIVNVDQAPIGATPASNPATYTGVFDWIRELFARLPESKVRGYNANRFSFNRPGGRCEACEGNGQKRIEMHFMPDVWITCETCAGKRYNPETLDIRFKGRTISDVIEMRVSDSLALFENVPRIRRMLRTLDDVGLGYLPLGQPAPTLSGGEAQRVKLAAELGRLDTGSTLYLLDEPTTGLHFEDVRRLLEVLHRLVDLGNTVLIVEHNLDVIASADWVIDLGPEAGDAGGALVAMGTPEDVAACDASHTGRAMRPLLGQAPRASRARHDPVAHLRQAAAEEKAGLGKIGREVRMPWQVDGRKWHLEQRTGRDGGARRWERAALEYVVELIEKTGRFAPTNWSNQASVEITAEGADRWFLHALTGGEWLLELYFRAPHGTFDAGKLASRLRLLTLDQREDIEAYGDWSRVDVRPRIDGFDAIVIYVHDKREIDTPAFRKFVSDAVRAYCGSAITAS